MTTFYCACSHDATCLGRYEPTEGPFEFACDRCCTHSRKDGICYPLESLSRERIAELVDESDRKSYGL